MRGVTSDNSRGRPVVGSHGGGGRCLRRSLSCVRAGVKGTCCFTFSLYIPAGMGNLDIVLTQAA